jgi:platelet-activating factor acetylhydrolase
MHYISIPVNKNAALEEPDNDTLDGRWPTMIFSHGLGGSRNAYSHLAGSLASHGVVVICPEHRDGSAVASFIRIPSEQDRFFIRNRRRVVPYNRIAHVATPEVYESREEQLRIRLWELGLVHAAVLAIDRGSAYTNLNTSTPSLDPFVGKMHVQEPGSIIFAGHSFGSSTMVQLLKTTYYAGRPELDAMEKPLFTPRKDSEICSQITERSVTMLLDMWCFPLLAPNSSPLFGLPLPVYADVPSAPGGNALLAVASEAFHNWKEHLHVTARVLSPDPSAKIIEPQLYERPSGVRLPEPNFFYVENSAHLSQSDFGILFPWLTKKIFSAEAPERALRLNLRAQLQLLRANGVPIARTWIGDLVDGAHAGKLDVNSPPQAQEPDKDKELAKDAGNKGPEDGIKDDKAIFDRSGSGMVEFWHWIDSIGMGDSGEDGSDASASVSRMDSDIKDVEAGEMAMEREMEPSAMSATATVMAAA